MGTDIHTFVEYAEEKGRRLFSGCPEEPAWFFGRFSLLRDYALFDALGDGRNSQMPPEDVCARALYPPRGIPPDISIPVAWEYYDLVVDAHPPHTGFWPKHGCVSASQTQERVGRGAHVGSVTQRMQFGPTPPRTWQVVSKEYWHTPSWLSLLEVHQSLEHHRLPLTDLRWDFRAVLKCLSEIEEQIGRGQVRMVFWFDN
jgi:hypothetical protein